MSLVISENCQKWFFDLSFHYTDFALELGLTFSITFLENFNATGQIYSRYSGHR